MPAHPIDGQPLLLAAAQASVGPSVLPGLLARAQSRLGPRLDRYRRAYEVAVETDERTAFFVEAGHWAGLGAEFDLLDRHADAVRRAHEAQLLFDGNATDRREEFEAALDLREAVVIGR
jgi:hypothetical protein